VSDSDAIEFPPLPGWRRGLGIVLAVLAGGCLVGFVAGTWNPWRLVWLRELFGNPFSGLVIVSLLALLAFVTLAPVLWTGSGLGMREDGSLGRPCDDFKTRFQGEDLVHIETNYGNFDVRLDPATGRALNPIGPTCSG
jgi:hypothetical protein